MFGRYAGYVVLDDGQRLEIRDLIGFAEEHRARRRRDDRLPMIQHLGVRLICTISVKVSLSLWRVYGNELTNQGIAVLKSGDKAEARRLLSLVVQHDAQDETAWLWLSGAVDTEAERLHCLQQVLAINPANAAAKRGMEMLQAKAVVTRTWM